MGESNELTQLAVLSSKKGGEGLFFSLRFKKGPSTLGGAPEEPPNCNFRWGCVNGFTLNVASALPNSSWACVRAGTSLLFRNESAVLHGVSAVGFEIFVIDRP